MKLAEARQILNKNGYLLEDRFGGGKDRFGHRIKRIKLSDLEDKPDENGYITVDIIYQDNYEDYIGKCVNVTGDVSISGLNLTEIPIKFGKVGGNFDCSHNKLKNLKNAPKKVGRGFRCEFNQLTSLKGSPKIVGEEFCCSYNQLTTLDTAPNKVGGWFDCCENKVKIKENDVRMLSDVEGVIYS